MIYFDLRSHDMYTKKKQLGYLQVSDGGLIQVNTGWRHKKRFLEHHELLFITKGTLILTVSGKEFTIKENQLMILPPYQLMEGISNSSEGISFFWVDFFTDMAEELQMPKSLIPVPIQNPNRILPLFTMLFEMLAVKTGKPDILASIMIVILYAAKTEQLSEAAPKSIVNDILLYIESHLSEKLTTTSVSKALNYNKDYICRVIRRMTGKTLKEYINQRKIEVARVLLRSSAYSVQEISVFLGYSDSNLFTKFFSYHQKVTPSEYRKGME